VEHERGHHEGAGAGRRQRCTAGHVPRPFGGTAGAFDQRNWKPDPGAPAGWMDYCRSHNREESRAAPELRRGLRREEPPHPRWTAWIPRPTPNKALLRNIKELILKDRREPMSDFLRNSKWKLGQKHRGRLSGRPMGRPAGRENRGQTAFGAGRREAGHRPPAAKTGGRPLRQVLRRPFQFPPIVTLVGTCRGFMPGTRRNTDGIFSESTARGKLLFAYAEATFPRVTLEINHARPLRRRPIRT